MARKILWLLCLSCFFCLEAHSQISIQFQEPDTIGACRQNVFRMVVEKAIFKC